MVDEDRLRLFPETCQPPQQSSLIGVTAGAVERGDLRIDGNILTKQANILCAILQLSAERAFCLTTHEQNGVFFSPKVVLQMVANTACFTHTAGI